jgi:hypothetical protein
LNFLNNINEFLIKEIKVNDLRSALHCHGQQNTYYIVNHTEKIYANSDLDFKITPFSTFLDSLDKNSFINALTDSSIKEIKVNDLRSALHYHGQQNTYYIEKIYANSDLDSVFTKTLECLGSITIKSLSDIENIKLKIIFHYYSEIVKGYSNIENLSPLIKRLEKRILDLEKVLTIKDDDSILERILCASSTIMCSEWLLLLSFFFLSYNSFTKSIGNILRISILTFRKETTVKFSLFSLESSSFIVKTFSKSNIRFSSLFIRGDRCSLFENPLIISLKYFMIIVADAFGKRVIR